MDNKKSIIIGSIVALVILAIVLLITFTTELYGFFVVLLTLFIILLISLGFYIKEKPDEYSVFQKEKKRILKTYSSAIIEVENLPNIAGKNIIKVKSMDDLVDAQLELREPIYYKNDNDSCFFLLLHYNEACIYILRLNPDVISPTEQSLRFIQMDDSKQLNYESLLDNIENTLVLKLDELRSVRISPVRNRKKIEVIDSSAIKEKIKENKDFNEKTLIDELSKTSIIKNLQEQLNNLEKEYKKDVKNETKKETKKEKEEEQKIAKTFQKIEEEPEESLYDKIMREAAEEEAAEEAIRAALKESPKDIKEEKKEEPEDPIIAQILDEEEPIKIIEEKKTEEKKIEEKKEISNNENIPEKKTPKKPKKPNKNTHAARRATAYKKNNK